MNDNTGYIIPFSGNSKKELECYLNEVKRRLSSYNISLYNIQVILEVLSRKKSKQYRVAFIVDDSEELLNLITLYLSDPAVDNKKIVTGNILQDTNFIGDSNEIKEVDSLGEIAQLWCWGLRNDANIQLDKQVALHNRRIDLGGYYYNSEHIPRSMGMVSPLNKEELINNQIRYEKFTLTGEEDFIQDHVLYGKSIAPAAMYIELLFKVFENKRVTIRNLTWSKVLDSFPVTLKLKITESINEVRVEFLDGNELLYCSADVVFNNTKQEFSSNIVDNQLFLSSIEIDSSNIYTSFSDMKINYGSTFQKLESYSSNDEVARGNLNKNSSYRMYDMTVIDAALQTALLFNRNVGNEVNYPFIVEEIESQGALEDADHIIVTKKNNKLNIGIYGINGIYLLGLNGYIGFSGKKKKNLMTFNYQIGSFSDKEVGKFVILLSGKKIAYHVGEYEVKMEEFLGRLSNESNVLINVKTGDYKQSYLNILGYFKSFLVKHKKVGYLIDYDLEDDLSFSIANAIYSFIKSAVAENGGGSVRLKNRLMTKDKTLLRNVFIKKGGIYIVTGGTGGIGQKIVNYITAMGGVPVVLGRSSTLVVKDDFVSLPIDITERNKLGSELRKYGVDRCHGIFHFAGSISDKLILNKEERLTNVILSKVDGLLNLMNCCSDFEFVVLASSLVSIAGNIGQSDYAFANGFLNGFSQIKSLKENFATFSLLWPFWKYGGMKMDLKEQEIMQNITGLEPISDEEGLKILFEGKKVLGCTAVLGGHLEKAYDWINSKGKVVLDEL